MAKNFYENYVDHSVYEFHEGDTLLTPVCNSDPDPFYVCLLKGTTIDMKNTTLIDDNYFTVSIMVDVKG